MGALKCAAEAYKGVLSVNLLAFHSEVTARTRSVPVLISARPSAQAARLSSCNYFNRARAITLFI